MLYGYLNKNVCLVFKSEMVKQLQEENLSLRQQLLLLQSSARGGAMGDVALLQSKLKQAARLISGLSQDKRQLIEMGNRLRAQLIEAGLEGLYWFWSVLFGFISISNQSEFKCFKLCKELSLAQEG